MFKSAGCKRISVFACIGLHYRRHAARSIQRQHRSAARCNTEVPQTALQRSILFTKCINWIYGSLSKLSFRPVLVAVAVMSHSTQSQSF